MLKESGAFCSSGIEFAQDAFDEALLWAVSKVERYGWKQNRHREKYGTWCKELVSLRLTPQALHLP